MIALIQRVTSAQVVVSGDIIGSIDKGLLVLLGIEKTDTKASADKLMKKVASYRVFEDENGKMNLNLQQINGQVLIVSQFTLVADTKSGNRPSFSAGATPELGKQLYEYAVAALKGLGVETHTGRFGANMQVSLVNDGPVTFSLRA